jgi:putative tryptophan/tyrosine transport system substrate-binding protein
MALSGHWIKRQDFACRNGSDMKRRDFVAGAISMAAISRVAAQTAAKSQRLAIVSPSEPAALLREDRDYRVLVELRRLGHVEGQNLIVERYGKEQNTSDLASLAADVVRSAPDVIYVVGPGAALFKTLTATIPIVTVTGDPVNLGLAQSLSHPGGNVTGASVDAGPSIHGKRLELLREIYPGMSRLALLLLRVQLEAGKLDAVMKAATAAAGVALVYCAVDLPTSEATYRTAISQAARDGADAIMVMDSPETLRSTAIISALIAAAKLPAMYSFPQSVEAGGLMAYSFDLVELLTRVASNIDAILRGSKPGDIPFYQASKFGLSINLKTAKALGLTVPATLLARADKVVED